MNIQDLSWFVFSGGNTYGKRTQNSNINEQSPRNLPDTTSNQDWNGWCSSIERHDIACATAECLDKGYRQCIHVEIGRYGLKRLLIEVGTSEYFLSLACRRAGLGRDCQKRLLTVLGTSQYLVIRILESCLNWKAWSKTIINRTWYISIHSYRWPADMFELKEIVRGAY